MRWTDPDIYAMDGLIRTIPWHIKQIFKISTAIESLNDRMYSVQGSRYDKPQSGYVSSTGPHEASYTDLIADKIELEKKRDKQREELYDICRRYALLDDEAAEIISEYYDFGWTITEIADAHYMSYSTVRRTLGESLKKMSSL